MKSIKVLQSGWCIIKPWPKQWPQWSSMHEIKVLFDSLLMSVRYSPHLCRQGHSSPSMTQKQSPSMPPCADEAADAPGALWTVIYRGHCFTYCISAEYVLMHKDMGWGVRVQGVNCTSVMKVWITLSLWLANINYKTHYTSVVRSAVQRLCNKTNSGLCILYSTRMCL